MRFNIFCPAVQFFWVVCSFGGKRTKYPPGTRPPGFRFPGPLNDSGAIPPRPPAVCRTSAEYLFCFFCLLVLLFLYGCFSSFVLLRYRHPASVLFCCTVSRYFFYCRYAITVLESVLVVLFVQKRFSYQDIHHRLFPPPPQLSSPTEFSFGFPWGRWKRGSGLWINLLLSAERKRL